MRDAVEEDITVGALRLRLRRPRRPEDLIDERAFAEDEFLPYWAELWPSALALACVLERAPLAGTRLLELGCGLGLPSLVAAARGAGVTATDWSPHAVRAVADNAARNGLDLCAETLRWDSAGQHEPSRESRFDLVVGSDLLYEARNGPWLLAALERLVAPAGEAWIADPGRATAAAFFTQARRRYAVQALAHDGPPTVTVHRLRPRGS